MTNNHNSDLHFRSSFWATFWVNAIWVIPFWLFFLPVLVYLSPNYRVPPNYVYVGWTIFLFIFGIGAAIYSWLVCVVTIKPDGIRGYDIWSNFSFVTWEEMTRVKSITFLGLRYLRVFFAASSPLWVPLFLSKQKKFVAAILDHAPESNPLRLSLVQGGTKQETSVDQGSQKIKPFQATVLQREKFSSTERPWMLPSVFPPSPDLSTYGYRTGIISLLLWSITVFLNFQGPRFDQIALFYLVAFGLIPFVENSWLLYRLKSFTLKSMENLVPEARYWVWIKNTQAFWTRALVGCIGVVGAIQLVVVIAQISSVEAAGIVKEAVWQGEVWRLLTGTLLHANLIHFLFNMFALLALGRLLEIFGHRVYLPLVFLVAALSGSLFSLFLLPDQTSVGASGGILGLLGFLIVLAWRQRQIFPAVFLRMLIVGVAYTAATGVLAYRIIDNPAHLGGLLAGLFLGILFVPRHTSTVPLLVSHATKFAGLLSAVIILGVAILCCYQLIAEVI